MKIVIVEDESLTSLFIKEVCEQQGHQVIAVYNNGEKLLEEYKQIEPDLILMDIELKGKLDGIQCATTIMQNRKIPSIYVTSYKNQEIIEEAMDAKPIGYLVKPVDESDIIAALLIAKRHLQSNAYQVEDSTLFEHNDYIYCSQSKQLTYQNNPIKLSQKERSTLELLIKNRNVTVSNEQLFEVLWPNDEPKESSLRELIYRLRNKVEHLEITALPKLGYALLTS